MLLLIEYMSSYKQEFYSIIKDSEKQSLLLEILVSIVNEGLYKGIVIFCGNFLLGVNARGECVPCIPELFEDTKGNVVDFDSANLCKRMNNERFDTKFSYFSFKIGLELYNRIQIKKQILLSADDKYIEKELSDTYFSKGYGAIPQIYLKDLEECFGGKGKIRLHLETIVENICDSSVGRLNKYLLSERYLVRRYMKKKQTKFGNFEYNQYYTDLGEKFSSCSLEIFHLLNMIGKNKTKIFKTCNETDKICVLMFVPDACTSSAMQGGLAISKIDENIDIINVTQSTTVEEGIVLISKINKGGVQLL